MGRPFFGFAQDASRGSLATLANSPGVGATVLGGELIHQGSDDSEWGRILASEGLGVHERFLDRFIAEVMIQGHGRAFEQALLRMERLAYERIVETRDNKQTGWVKRLEREFELPARWIGAGEREWSEDAIEEVVIVEIVTSKRIALESPTDVVETQSGDVDVLMKTEDVEGHGVEGSGDERLIFCPQHSDEVEGTCLELSVWKAVESWEEDYVHQKKLVHSCFGGLGT
eukprot:s1820_g14.t1